MTDNTAHSVVLANARTWTQARTRTSLKRPHTRARTGLADNPPVAPGVDACALVRVMVHASEPGAAVDSYTLPLSVPAVRFKVSCAHRKDECACKKYGGRCQ